MDNKEHRKLVEKRISNEGRRFFKKIEFDEEEEFIMEIRKHSLGWMLILIFGGLFASALLALSVLVLSPNGLIGEDISNTFRDVASVVTLLLVVFVSAVTIVSSYLYRSDVIFVTNEKIARARQVSIFNQKISQVSMGSIQSVDVDQKGIVANLLKYGTLQIRTPGDVENISFIYAIDPFGAASSIQGAHERFKSFNRQDD